MDYEKKYKEALERARQFSEKPYLEDSKGIVEYIFPELKESEGERIRKVIADIVKAQPSDSLFNGTKEKCLAWLEKQGEQKPTDETPYPETLEKAIDLYYYSYGNGEGGFEHLSLEKFRDIVHTFVSDYGQKPAWSEEDEAGLSDAMWAIEQARTIAKDENDMGNLWYAEHWLKSLKERYTWKPSDEQMDNK